MYPVLLNLNEKKIVIIGAGRIALRKAKEVLTANGKIIVIAPAISPEFYEFDQTTIINRPYEKKDIEDAQLIFACTDSKQVNQQVVEDCSNNQWVNDCSKKENSDFYNMATVRQANYLYALSSYGEDPKELKKRKENLANMLKNQEATDFFLN